MANELDALSGIEIPSLTNFWSWVKKTFTVTYQAEIEAYLAESSSHADLEYRIRTLQRRGMI